MEPEFYQVLQVISGKSLVIYDIYSPEGIIFEGEG